jgi:hypothetical protein
MDHTQEINEIRADYDASDLSEYQEKSPYAKLIKIAKAVFTLLFIGIMFKILLFLPMEYTITLTAILTIMFYFGIDWLLTKFKLNYNKKYEL